MRHPPLGGKNPSTRQDPHEHWVFFRATRQVTRQSRQATRHITVVYKQELPILRYERKLGIDKRNDLHNRLRNQFHHKD
jgi:hypothetical protein